MREEVIYKVFLALLKAYNTLSRDHYLEIIVSYGIGLMMYSILWIYWEYLLMVAQSRCYYRALFKVYRGITHVDTLS